MADINTGQDVDIVSPLPAGTNAIGKLAANSGVDIGDVDLSPAGTATQANVAGSATSVTLLAANTARKMASVFNDSTVRLYINFGAAASTTAHVVQVLPKQLYELTLPVYTGALHGLWESATGSARVSELV